MMTDGPMLFAPQGSREFGKAVGERLGIALSPLEEREFEDGEHKIRPLANVRDRDVFVIHSLCADATRSVNDKLLRLLLLVGALGDASAGRVTAVVPYLAYARKDQKSKSRDPVTTRYVASLFEAVGTHCVVTLDVHNVAAFQNAFRCRAENLEACGLLVAHFVPRLAGADVTIVSPDSGGIKRAERFRERLAEALGRPVGAAFVEKYRSAGVLSGGQLVGDVEGRVAIIVDDLISAGNTVDRAARACRDHGARHVYAAASHGVFAGQANEVLSASPVEHLVVTDTIPGFRIRDPGLEARIARVATTGLFAEAISRLHSGGSIVELRER